MRRVRLGAVALLSLRAAAVGDGLPVEYLLSHQWRNLFIHHSPLTNPALISEQHYFSVRGALSVAPEKIARLWEAGIVVPIRRYQTAALTLVGENGMPVDGGRFNETGEYVFEETNLSNDNTFVMLTYANTPVHRLALGASLNVLYQSNFGDPRTSLGLDIGAFYPLLRHSFLGTHGAGVTARNYLFLAVDPDIERVRATQLNATLHSTFLENRVELDIQADVSDLLSRQSDFVDRGRIPEWDVFFQGGVWLLRALTVHGFAGIGQRRLEHWGLCFGINLPSFNGGRDLAAAYQLRHEREGDLRPSHTMYCRADFGEHRFEQELHRRLKKMNISPNQLYNRAMTEYWAGRFWKAYFLYTRIRNEFPDFFKNDLVTHYMGACLEEMDMREAGLSTYTAHLDSFPTSEMVPASELGMMRIHYREGDLHKARELYRSLTSFSREVSAGDSIRHHATYLRGQIAMAEEDYSHAIRLLSMVPETHPSYLFAQHSLAVSYVLLTGSTAKAEVHLGNCVGRDPQTDVQKEIVHRSLLFLGYIFFENGTLSKAVVALRMVPRGSHYYPEALLGLGWAAIRASQYDDCVDAGGKLVSAAEDTILRCEGMLIRGYGLLRTGDTTAAEVILKDALAAIGSYDGPEPDSLRGRKRVYSNNRIAYAQLAEGVRTCAGLSESDMKARMHDSLRTVQLDMKEKLDAHLHYVDRFERGTFFGRNRETVRSDLEFMLASLQKGRFERETRETMDKTEKQMEEIDDKIDQLKRELGEEGEQGR